MHTIFWLQGYTIFGLSTDNEKPLLSLYFQFHFKDKYAVERCSAISYCIRLLIIYKSFSRENP